jgi:hypothetical protein
MLNEHGSEKRWTGLGYSVKECEGTACRGKRRWKEEAVMTVLVKERFTSWMLMPLISGSEKY